MSTTAIAGLLSDLEAREKRYTISRFEDFRVEPHHDGIRISGSEGTKRHQMDMEAVKFFQFAGIPAPLQGKLTRGLLTEIAQEMLYIDKQGRFSVLMNNQEPVCFQSFSAPYVPTAQVLNRIFEQAGPAPWTVADMEDAPDHTNIDLYNDVTVIEPKVGDVTRMGLHLSLYDSMNKPDVVEGYTHRLFCANGAHVRYNNRSYSIHADASPTAVIEQIAARAARLMADLPAFVLRESQQLINTEVPNAPVAINRLIEDLATTGASSARHTDRVHEAFSEEPGNSMWEVQQAFSRAANSLDSYDARSSLRANAGKLLEQAEKARCGGCYRRLTH